MSTLLSVLHHRELATSSFSAGLISLRCSGRVLEDTGPWPDKQIVVEAMNYVGAPYVWGVTTPGGFDCSGFTYDIVNKVAGTGPPRDMTGQSQLVRMSMRTISHRAIWSSFRTPISGDSHTLSTTSATASWSTPAASVLA